ncbi:alpha/beta hydrolase family protein [Dactylosporangium cerinum]
MNAAAPVSARLHVTLGGDAGPVRSVLLHPAGGGITPYLQLGLHLSRRGPVAAIRADGLMPGELPQHDVKAMVEAYAPLLAAPGRPDLLIGWSLGECWPGSWPPGSRRTGRLPRSSSSTARPAPTRPPAGACRS